MATVGHWTIKGTILGPDGTETEFLLHPDLGSWSQWGGVPRESLGERVEYLDAMQQGLAEHSDYFNQEAEDETEDETEPEAEGQQ